MQTNNHRVVAVVGMCGAGKSVVADTLVERGYAFLRFGQIVLDIVKERHLEPLESNEKGIREEVRKKHGMAAMAILNLPKIKNLLEKSHVVVDGLYSWSEYKVLREEFGDRLTVIAVYAPPRLRYERLAARKLLSADTNLRNRPITPDDAKKRDYSEIENIEKGGPIAMADYTVVNSGSRDTFKKNIALVIGELKE